MTLKEFFLGRALVLLVVLFLGFAFFVYQAYFTARTPEPVPDPVVQQSTQPPTFAWTFEDDDMLNPDGNPQTNIFLEATYSDGTLRKELIDTVPSSCTTLPDPEEGSVPNTSAVQCYGAGLGYVYKITEGEQSYRVERKQFEEASPEYEPPVSEYEVIAEWMK